MLSDLYDKFYQIFYGYLIASILVTLTIFAFIIFSKAFIRRTKHFVVSPTFTFCLILVIAFVMDGYLLFNFNLAVGDLNTVKDGGYEIVIGEVIGYTRGGEGNDGLNHSNHPIIQPLDSEESITLNVLNTELNEIYTFYYLENTKIAVIIEDTNP